MKKFIKNIIWLFKNELPTKEHTKPDFKWGKYIAKDGKWFIKEGKNLKRLYQPTEYKWEPTERNPVPPPPVIATGDLEIKAG